MDDFVNISDLIHYLETPFDFYTANTVSELVDNIKNFMEIINSKRKKKQFWKG